MLLVQILVLIVLEADISRLFNVVGIRLCVEDCTKLLA